MCKVPISGILTLVKLETFMALSTASSVSFFLKYNEIANDVGANGKIQKRLSPILYLQN